MQAGRRGDTTCHVSSASPATLTNRKEHPAADLPSTYFGESLELICCHQEEPQRSGESAAAGVSWPPDWDKRDVGRSPGLLFQRCERASVTPQTSELSY